MSKEERAAMDQIRYSVALGELIDEIPFTVETAPEGYRDILVYSDDVNRCGLHRCQYIYGRFLNKIRRRHIGISQTEIKDIFLSDLRSASAAELKNRTNR